MGNGGLPGSFSFWDGLLRGLLRRRFAVAACLFLEWFVFNFRAAGAAQT